jgi:hypothetical protein
MSRKANVESYIRYQAKTGDGKKYAAFCPSNRRHGGKDIYLGVVINENEGIFYNRNSGYFRFTIEDGRTPLTSDEAKHIELTRKPGGTEIGKHLILDFGDAWFLDHVMRESELKELFMNVLPKESDTLLSLIAFKLLDTNANCYAQRWFAGSYAQYLYPKASLESPRISEFMERLGKEETKRAFFNVYILKSHP